MDLVPVDPPSYRSKRRVRSSWLKEWGPGILFFVLLATAFGWWYVKEYRNRQHVLSSRQQSTIPPRDLPARRSSSDGWVDIPNGVRAVDYTPPLIPPPGPTLENRRMAEAFGTSALRTLYHELAKSGSAVRCIAGYVFRVTSENGVPTYRQETISGAPVTCRGGNASTVP